MLSNHDILEQHKVSLISQHAEQSIGTAVYPSSSGIDLQEENTNAGGQHERMADVMFLLDVSTINSTGTLTITVQDYNHQTATWDTDFAVIEAISAAGLYVATIKNFNRKMRFSCVVASAAVSWGGYLIGFNPMRFPVKQTDSEELTVTYASDR